MKYFHENHDPVINDDNNNARYDRGYRDTDSDSLAETRPFQTTNRQPEIKQVASHPSVPSSLTKETNTEGGETFHFSGILEFHPKGFGFLRPPKANYIRSLFDPFVSKEFIQQYNLREGVLISAMVHPNFEGNGPRLIKILDVEGLSPDDYSGVKPFDERDIIAPEGRYRLETGQYPLSTRIFDIMVPLSRGGRGLVFAPPKSGKAVLFHQVFSSIMINYPETHIIAFFIDESPEDINDFRLAVKAEVISAKSSEQGNLIRLTQLVRKRCQRLLEVKKDVILLIDSITCLTHSLYQWGNMKKNGAVDAYTNALRTVLDILLLAGKTKGGGTLTIVGSVLIDTGDKMDNHIFHDFNKRGNMHLVLDGRMADHCIWPAMNFFESGTQHAERILSLAEVRTVLSFRRLFRQKNPIEAMKILIDTVEKYKSNAQMIEKMT